MSEYQLVIPKPWHNTCRVDSLAPITSALLTTYESLCRKRGFEDQGTGASQEPDFYSHSSGCGNRMIGALNLIFENGGEMAYTSFLLVQILAKGLAACPRPIMILN